MKTDFSSINQSVGILPDFCFYALYYELLSWWNSVMTYRNDLNLFIIFVIYPSLIFSLYSSGFDLSFLSVQLEISLVLFWMQFFSITYFFRNNKSLGKNRGRTLKCTKDLTDCMKNIGPSYRNKCNSSWHLGGCSLQDLSIGRL